MGTQTQSREREAAVVRCENVDAKQEGKKTPLSSPFPLSPLLAAFRAQKPSPRKRGGGKERKYGLQEEVEEEIKRSGAILVSRFEDADVNHKKNNFPFMFCVNEEGGQEEIPFPLPPLLPSLLVTNRHTHPVQGGGRLRRWIGGKCGLEEEVEEEEGKGGRMNFPLLFCVVQRSPRMS